MVLLFLKNIKNFLKQFYKYKDDKDEDDDDEDKNIANMILELDLE